VGTDSALQRDMGSRHVRALGNLESGKLGGSASKKLAKTDRQIPALKLFRERLGMRQEVRDSVVHWRTRRCNSIGSWDSVY
jgi:hypothetical protein